MCKYASAHCYTVIFSSLLMELTHFLGIKMLESHFSQENYVKELKIAITRAHKGIIPF